MRSSTIDASSTQRFCHLHRTKISDEPSALSDTTRILAILNPWGRDLVAYTLHGTLRKRSGLECSLRGEDIQQLIPLRERYRCNCFPAGRHLCLSAPAPHHYLHWNPWPQNSSRIPFSRGDNLMESMRSEADTTYRASNKLFDSRTGGKQSHRGVDTRGL